MTATVTMTPQEVALGTSTLRLVVTGRSTVSAPEGAATSAPPWTIRRCGGAQSFSAVV